MARPASKVVVVAEYKSGVRVLSVLTKTVIWTWMDLEEGSPEKVASNPRCLLDRRERDVGEEQLREGVFRVPRKPSRPFFEAWELNRRMCWIRVSAQAVQLSR
jgi:tRNA (Thr-GGU) A37 N-methylase